MEIISSSPEEVSLPECKVRRNYSCNYCLYFTQNPRSHLAHLRDIHGERILINNCRLCLYASRHYQKLVRHMKMVHGSIGGIREQPKRRIDPIVGVLHQQQPIRVASPTLPPLPAYPDFFEKTIDFTNLASALELSRNSLKDFAVIYFAEDHIDKFIKQMEKADAIHLPPSSKLGSSHDWMSKSMFSESNLTCRCGSVSKCFSQYKIHRKICRNSVRKSTMPTNTWTGRCQNCGQLCNSMVDLLHHWCDYGRNGFEESVDQQTYSEAYPIDLSSKSTRCQHCHCWCTSYESLVNHLLDCLFGGQKENEVSGKTDVIDLIDVEKQDDSTKEDIFLKETCYYGIEMATGYGKVIKLMTPQEKLTSSPMKKVFKCSRCSFWASTSSRFHIHVVGHINKKPFKCSLCSYRSNWRWDITKHIRIKALRNVCHKNAKVVMNGEGGRVDYSKYKKYISLKKITDEEEVAQLTKYTEGVGKQVAPPCDLGASISCSKLNDATPVNSEEKKSLGDVKDESGSAECCSDSEIDVASSTNPVSLDDNRKQLCDDQNDAVLKKEEFKTGNGSISLLKSLLLNEPLMNSSQQSRQPIHSQISVENNGITDGATLTESDFPAVCSNTVTSMKDVKSNIFNIKRKEPSPFRCGHCHQLSNWKHVIQRHCRLKHSGSIKIEAFDPKSDRRYPVYHSFELPCSQKNSCLPLVEKESKRARHLTQDLFRNKTEIIGSSLAGRRFKCHLCPFISKTKTQFNFHISLHKPPINVKNKMISPDTFVDTLHDNEKNNSASISPDTLEKCPHCPFQSVCYKTLKKHLQFHICVTNRREKHICQHCDFNTSSEAIFAEHSRIHLEEIVNRNAMTSSVSHNNSDLEIEIKNDEAFNRVRQPTIKLGNALNKGGKTEKDKMPPPSSSNHKTILVNPKTGQVIKKN